MFRLSLNQTFKWPAKIGLMLINALTSMANELDGAALTKRQAVQLASSLALVWQQGCDTLEQCCCEARSSQAATESLAAYVMSQITAVAPMICWLQDAAPGAAASFARGFAKPRTFLPWLTAMAQALQLAAESRTMKGGCTMQCLQEGWCFGGYSPFEYCTAHALVCMTHANSLTLQGCCTII
jgi:hypothetical protein